MVIGIIAETLNTPRGEITTESKLTELAKDSIALFELLIRLEEALGKHVQYEEIADIETVGDILFYVDTLPIDSATLTAPKDS